MIWIISSHLIGLVGIWSLIRIGGGDVLAFSPSHEVHLLGALYHYCSNPNRNDGSGCNYAFVASKLRQSEQIRLAGSLPRLDGPGPKFRPRLIQAKSDNGNEDDETDEELLPESDEDWRAFRAKLVMSEKSEQSSTASSQSQSNPSMAMSTEGNVEGDTIIDDSDLDGIGSIFADSTISTTSSTTGSTTSTSSQTPQSFPGFTPLSPTQWAYDSGTTIEKGTIILGGVEQDFGFGLRQQYFHKAVILVLEHDEKTFTKGIILNRPSNRMMKDDVNVNSRGDCLEWRVWFGGDVQGLDSLLPEVVCLHSLRGVEAREASVTVMKDIQWTSFTNAKKLVQRSLATPQDFWLFAGYAGWGPRQLSSELDRKSWYMCATDSQTLLKELARQSSGVDPRDAGLETWELLMHMIGRVDTVRKCSGGFDDLILKEWGREHLLLKGGDDVGGEMGKAKSPMWGTPGSLTGMDNLMGSSTRSAESVDDLMKEAAELALGGDIAEGVLLRGSSADRSPFLLAKQEFHKSLVLIILEDEKATVGVILNHAATKGYEIKSSVGSASVPLRYGGDYAVKGQSPLLWLHCDQKLRDSGVGTAFGDKKGGIYKCSQEQATEAISYNIAKPQDFLVVSGVCVWPKLGGSLANEVKRGMFEIVPPPRVESVFRSLQKQEILTENNLAKNVELTHEAWQKAVGSRVASTDKESEVLTLGIGEGFDEDDDTVVFNSDKKVSDLADEALKKWVGTFLLGSPNVG